MHAAKENNQNIKILKIIFSNICILNDVFITKAKHSLLFKWREDKVSLNYMDSFEHPKKAKDGIKLGILLLQPPKFLILRMSPPCRGPYPS